MNKYQIREIANITMYHKFGMTDTVARALSALIRSAKRQPQKAAMIEYADMFGVRNHPEFVI
jgi:hypothetical protein